jgi:hypothetical protein
MGINDAAFEEIRWAVETGADPAFWRSRTPEERLIALELMRHKKYGYDEHSMPKLQRVIEIVDLKKYQPESANADNSADLPKDQS